jgi:hypothetical protein
MSAQDRVQRNFSVPIPWQPGVQPTAHEVLDWFLQLPHGEQIDWMNQTQDCMYQALHCLQMDHVGNIDHMQRENVAQREKLTALTRENAELRYQAHQQLGLPLKEGE